MLLEAGALGVINGQCGEEALCMCHVVCACMMCVCVCKTLSVVKMRGVGRVAVVIFSIIWLHTTNLAIKFSSITS